MKISIRAVLAGAAATALMAVGAVSPASAATEPKMGEWTKWERTSGTIVYPKGYACKHKVVEKWVSTDRTKEVKPGVIIAQTRDSKSVFYGKHGKKFKTSLNGTVKMDYTAKKDGSDLKLTFYNGRTLGQGNGVYGLLLTDGYLKVHVKKANDPAKAYPASIDLRQVKWAKQLCYTLGSKPVWGKNLPVEEE